MVDAVNPVFGLDDHTAILVDVRGSRVAILILVALGLRLLSRDAAILATARVDLQGSLVGGNVQTNTGLLGGQTGRGDERVLGSVGRAVDQEACVVAGAATAAETRGLLNVLTDQLWRGEIQRAIVGSRNV